MSNSLLGSNAFRSNSVEPLYTAKQTSRYELLSPVPHAPKKVAPKEFC